MGSVNQKCPLHSECLLLVWPIALTPSLITGPRWAEFSGALDSTAGQPGRMSSVSDHFQQCRYFTCAHRSSFPVPKWCWWPWKAKSPPQPPQRYESRISSPASGGHVTLYHRAGIRRWIDYSTSVGRDLQASPRPTAWPLQGWQNTKAYY